MEVKQYEFTISTRKKYELVYIEDKIKEIVEQSGIKDGIVLIFIPHATAALYFNEDEEGLKEDFINFIKENFEKEGYKHNLIDNNAHAHLANVFVKPFLILPLKNGKIVKGTWQSIFLAEFDGPRAYRKVYVVIIGK